MRIKTFGDVDQRSLEQLERCMEAGDAEFGVLCADHHPGYSQPIGGGIAYEGYISPSGVGYDIACGNKAAETDLTREQLEAAGGAERVMLAIAERISFGMGVPAKERVDHPVIDRIAAAPFEPQRKLRDTAAKQLGTVGSGNHFVNLFEDERGKIWVGVHFGSRGFGFKTASGFLALAQELPFDEAERKRRGVRVTGGGMDSPPVLFAVDSELGQAYVEAMALAGEYAYAGRDVVVDKVLDILGARAVHEVHNHHNFAWLEEHHGRRVWVVRKGCTPAQPGQEGFVGGSMGEPSVILEGAESGDSAESLYSTVHGAGRVMSRTQAAGRVKRGKVVRPGVVDWPRVKERLQRQGIALVGGGADEAPEVYKRLPEVLAAHGDSIRVKHTLTPLGVAMAGADVVDPYRD
jgi:tRNA-splicing ligase RtcB